VPFSSFAEVAPNQTVVMNGVAVTASGQQTTIGDTTTITSVELDASGSATVRLTYDGSRTLSGIGVTTPQSITDVSFNRSSPGHSIGCSAGTCDAENATSAAAFVDPFTTNLNWNYQTFGVWAKDLSATSWAFGAASVGRITPGNAVPTTNSANFIGLSAGFYIDTSGAPHATAAPINLAVNFGSRSIQYTTTADTSLVNANTGIQTTNSGLNLSGTLSYSAGSSAFSGTLQTQNTQLSGPASGNFYGPGAQEAGGVYSLSGTGVSRMIGGFGAKR
jgi:hypothetical protein